MESIIFLHFFPGIIVVRCLFSISVCWLVIAAIQIRYKSCVGCLFCWTVFINSKKSHSLCSLSQIPVFIVSFGCLVDYLERDASNWIYLYQFWNKSQINSFILDNFFSFKIWQIFDYISFSYFVIFLFSFFFSLIKSFSFRDTNFCTAFSSESQDMYQMLRIWIMLLFFLYHLWEDMDFVVRSFSLTLPQPLFFHSLTLPPTFLPLYWYAVTIYEHIFFLKN